MPQGMTHHTKAVLTLLTQITGERAFAGMFDRYDDMEGMNMCEIFEGFREQYRSQGIAIGEARGKRKQSQDIALKLMSMHMCQEDIAHATGLSLQDIRDLAAIGYEILEVAQSAGGGV